MEPEVYERNYEHQRSHWWFKSREKALDVLLHDHLPRGKVLDVGCGPGPYLNYFSKYGQVVGVDPYEPALAMARNIYTGTLVLGNAMALPFEDNSFQLVAAIDVLYHRGIWDVDRAVREMVRVLSPGGSMVVMDAAYNFLSSTSGQHVARRFTRGELNNILLRAGLVISRSTYAYSVLFPVVWVARKIHALIDRDNPPESELKAVPGWLNSALIKWFGLEAAIGGRYSLPFGLAIHIIAKKPKDKNDCW